MVTNALEDTAFAWAEPSAGVPEGRAPRKREPSAGVPEGRTPRKCEWRLPPKRSAAVRARLRPRRINGCAVAIDQELSDLRVVNGDVLPAADGTPRLPYVGYDDDGYPCSAPGPVEGQRHDLEVQYVAYSLRAWLGEHHPEACLGSDLGFYWRRGGLKRSTAPDIMVALGVGNHDRDSFKMWEERRPEFVLEVLSNNTYKADLGWRKRVYQMLRIPEHWLIDVTGKRLPGGIVGYRHAHGRRYRPIRARPGTDRFASDVFPFDFRVRNGRLEIVNARNGEVLPRHDELLQRHAEVQRRHDEVERRHREEQAGRLAAEAEVARLQERLRQAGLLNGAD